MGKNGEAFERLVGILNDLRTKCPWDMKQTIASLRPLTIEETFELGDAIINEDWKGIKEESGDLLLHIIFYARIATEQGQFTLDEAIHAVCEKLISRHPHIYGNVVVKDEEEVKQNWEKIKMKEGKKSVLSGVPKGLPSLVKATRLQEKSKDVGFEWDTKAQVWEKVKEETTELLNAEESGNISHVEEEFGDLLFSLVNYARFLKIDADTALEKTNQKFISRFTAMEEEAIASGKQLSDLSLDEMDQIWARIKSQRK